MNFQYDTYIPLDTENSKSETTPRKAIRKEEFLNVIHEFPWSDYPDSPTISVYRENPKMILWVSLYATSENQQQMFIIGYHRPVISKGFLCLCKPKEKEKMSTFHAVGQSKTQELFKHYFQSDFKLLEEKLSQFDSEIRM